MIRKISAHYVFPLSGPPIKYGIIVCTSMGEILEIVENKTGFREIASLEFFSGVLIPGFVKKAGETDQMMFDQLKRNLQNCGLSLHQTLKSLIMDEAERQNKENLLGSFEKSKMPGINLLTQIDYSSMKLLSSAELKIIIPVS